MRSTAQSVEFTPLLSESTLARIHFVVHAKPGGMPNVDTRELEARLVQVTRRWQDDLADALLDAFGEEQGNRLLQHYARFVSPPAIATTIRPARRCAISS